MQNELPQQINNIVDQAYPQLFSQLEHLMQMLMQQDVLSDNQEFISIANRMSYELDEMYRKEKLVLFPHLLKLYESHTKIDNCKPFVSIKNHYKSVQNLMRSMILLMKETSEQPSNDGIMEEFEYFGHQFEDMYKQKEQNIFNPFLDGNSSYYLA